MGLDLLLASLGIHADREPDWDACAKGVDTLELPTILNTGDDFFPWEGWLESYPNVPAALGVYHSLRSAQCDAREAAAWVRTALEDMRPDELLCCELPEHRLYLTGAPSVGNSPGPLFEAFTVFAEIGAARAAGFGWWSNYTGVPLDERKFKWDRKDLRQVRATRAFMYAEDASEELLEQFEASEPPE